LFGNTNTQTNTTGGGLFGQAGQQQNAQQPAAGGGLFGGAAGGGMFGAKPAAPATGGLFGNTQAQQQPAQTGSLFGNTAQTGGGLFGSTNNTLGQSQQNNQPKPGGLFGGGGGLFGAQTQQQPQQTGTTGGMFGNLGQSQAPQTSLFGSQNQQQPQQNGMGGSLFGGGLGLGQSTNNNNQAQQPSLNASIDQNPYGRNELFNYTGQKLEFGSQNKKPALPPLTASSYRITPSKNQINKLRGFATPLSASQSPGRSSTPLSSSRGGMVSPASDRYKGLTDTALTPNAFVPRPSIKRLNVTPKSNGAGSSNGDDHLESVLGKSALKSSVSKSSVSQNQNGLSNSMTLTFNPPTNGNSGAETPSRRQPTPLESSRPLAVAGSEKQPSHGQYWCKPRMEKLRQMGDGYLSKISNFTIGRSGFGEVTFLEPVDVTGFDLNDLFGKVVVFTEMELAVYPDDWEDKPPQGQGLNHPARITLLNCYPRDKATKQFITDLSDPRHARFLKRVKNIPETEFVSYTDDGAWTFEVQHFSKYGLRGESDEDDEEDVSVHRQKAVHGSNAKAKEAYRRTSPLDRTPSRTPESEDEDEGMPPTKSIRDAEHDSGIDEDEEESEGSRSRSPSRSQVSDAEDETETESASTSSEAPPGYDTEMEERRDQLIHQKLGHEGMVKLRQMQGSMFGLEKSQIRPAAEKRGLGRDTGKRTLGDRLAGFGSAGEDSVMLGKRAAKVSLDMSLCDDGCWD
jgi:nuclear pore complex protein Nup98-Nup96